MPSQAPILVCDFDGTLTDVDVGDALCSRFAPPAWEELDQRWLRGEVALPEAQRQMWGMVRAGIEQLVDEAHRVGRLRTGAEQLFDAAEAGHIELVIASGGFDVYIDALLGARRSAVDAMYCNRLVAHGCGVRPEFPHGDLACGRCAVCKGRVVSRMLGAGRRVAFCGDGSSDRCAADVCEEVYAVRGGILQRYCQTAGRPHVPFDDLRTVVRALLSS